MARTLGYAPPTGSILIPSSIPHPTSVSQHPALKRTQDDCSDIDSPSQPSKKSRVTFDPDVEYVSADDVDDADPQLVREQVRRAIQRHLNGENDEGYEKLKRIFSISSTKENAPSPKVIYVHLIALLSHVSSLNKNCSDLVNAVVFSEWIGRDEKYVSLFSRFLSNLAAATTGYLWKVLRILIDQFGQQRTRRLPGYSIVRQDRIHARARHAIILILSLVPPASGSFIKVLQKRLSVDFAKPQERVLLTKNMLLLADKVSQIKGAILGLITAELVKLDVSVQVDMDDYADDLEEEIVRAVSSQQTLIGSESQSLLSDLIKNDQSGDAGIDDGASTSSEEEDDVITDQSPAGKHRRRVMAHLETVDALMALLFDYYDRMFQSTSLNDCDETMELLTGHFSNIILPSYRSRHAQFLIFHFTQTSSVYIDKFATTCVAALVDSHQPATIRQTAGSYLAGFVGRGAHVPQPVIRASFRLLCDELESLRQDIEPKCKGPDLTRYTSFYSTMQAIMYIFCFRWRDLANPAVDSDDSDSDDDEAQPDQFHYSPVFKAVLLSAINSPMNPLRVCTLDIVNQFAETCRRVNFMYLFPKLETNKYVRLSTVRRTMGDAVAGHVERDLAWVGESGMLEGYFPFDPYKLPRSGKWLVDDYLEWKGLPGDEVGDEDEGDGSEDDVMADESAGEEETETTATEDE